MCDIVPLRGKKIIGAIVMGKREFNNRMSLRGEQESSTWQSQQNKMIGRNLHVSPLDFLRLMTNLKTVIAPSRYSRSSDLRISNIINGVIGSPLEFFCDTKLMVTICYILVTTVSGVSIARAECVPLPDCASIGYTATSCDGGSIKCPFDITKLFCLPCDSKYKYTCSGDNIAGGIGSSCNSKYVSCTCSNNYSWSDGICVMNCSDNSCKVGHIIYSDGSCCKENLTHKVAVGIVVKDNSLVISQPTPMKWSASSSDVKNLSNITLSSTVLTNMNGKNNTSTIVSYHTSVGETTSTSAALYCNSYSGVTGTSGKWYLPDAGELYTYMYENYSMLNLIWSTLGWSLTSNYFWSSSEYGAGNAWHMQFNTGGMYNYSKANLYSVSCFLVIN